MITLKFYTQSIIFFTLVIVSTSCAFSNAIPKKVLTQDSNLKLASIKYEPPPPPPTSGEPTQRGAGGGGRGCEPIALVPKILDKEGSYLWGQTVAERPQFWFVLPRKLTKKDAVTFVLEKPGKEIYKTTLKSEIPKGIISFTIPKQIPPLQIGKTYSWSLSLSCDFETLEDKPGEVQGTIQRVAISTQLKNQLAGAKTPVEQANAYAKNGIWFDTLTTIAVNMRGQKPKDVSIAWNQLLQQVNLEKAAPLPINNCCNN